MNLVVTRIKWIMLVSGLLTCTMFYAAIAPQAALMSMFGETLTGPLAEIVVRNWGALIALSGAMLIYGAYNPPVRQLVLTVASASKLIFSGLVLSQGSRYFGHQAGGAVIIDLIMVMLFIAYLFGARRNPAIT
ncbi:MAG: hypothetical protein KA368_08485 [Acidobacteria bacterium]|nr:hypothetical protein [Acidobacteriota bacterium]